MSGRRPDAVIEAVRSRRSHACVDEADAPGDDELLGLVEAAAGAADHAGLRPWRLVVVRGDARHRLGEALAAARPGADERERARAAAKPLRAPLLLGIVLRPVDHPKVPRWEQLAAAVGVVSYLSLMLDASGWGVMWRSGDAVTAAPVRRAMGVAAGEQLLGWLYVGRPTGPDRLPRAARPVTGHVSVLQAGLPPAGRPVTGPRP